MIRFPLPVSLAGVLLAVSPTVLAQAPASPLIAGMPSTWTFRVNIDDGSVTKCNVEVAISGGATSEHEVTAPNFEVRLPITPATPGPVALNWRGKTKFRGLNSVSACPGSGTVNATVLASADFVRERWNQTLAKLDAQQKECVQVGMNVSGLLMQSVDPTARLTDPTDAAMKPIYQTCDAFLAKRPRDNVDCTTPGRAKTTCEEGWRTEVDGQRRRLSFAEAVRATFENRPVTLALYEKADAREARERAERDAAARAAAELAAKKEAEEKQRRWLESPEYKKQQAEIAAREQRARDDEARRKLAEERERAERERLAAEQKRRDEEARLKALANLKVKGVGLGIGPVPCTADDATYVDILQKPARLQYQCRFGPENDQTLVVFAADRKTVVSVTRRQYLKPSDPEPGDVVRTAIKFYGPPTAADDGNWMALYGNPYNVSYNGRRANTEENPNGVGLLIKGQLCGDGRFGTARCGNLGTTVIEYELINHPAYYKQIEDGKARLAGQNKARLSNQTF